MPEIINLEPKHIPTKGAGKGSMRRREENLTKFRNNFEQINWKDGTDGTVTDGRTVPPNP